MNIKSVIRGSAAAALLASSTAFAGPVDLGTWTSEENSDLGNISPTSVWTVLNAPANDAVHQSENSVPSFFEEAGASSLGQSLSGNVTVETTSDNDYIGFVLGFNAGEANSGSAEFILIDWKQSDQSGHCSSTAVDGLAISLVTDTSASSGGECDFWLHSGGVGEIAQATSLGSTSWADNTSYASALEFTASVIDVSVDGNLELSITAADAGLASFSDGAFDFYNCSQSTVLCSAIEEDIANIPAPAGLGLLGLGLLGMRARRRAA